MGVFLVYAEEYEQDYGQYEEGFYEEDRRRIAHREGNLEMGEYVSDKEGTHRVEKKARKKGKEKKHKKEKKQKEKRRRSSPPDSPPREAQDAPGGCQ